MDCLQELGEEGELMDGLIVAPDSTPAERMAEAVRELRDAQSQFDLADPDAFEAVNAMLTAAQERIGLIVRGCDPLPGRRRRDCVWLPWLRWWMGGYRCAS